LDRRRLGHFFTKSPVRTPDDCNAVVDLIRQNGRELFKRFGLRVVPLP
jgi:hypothetical protein